MDRRSRLRDWKLRGQNCCLAIICIAAFVGRATSQSQVRCTPRYRGPTDPELAIGNVSSEARALGPYACDLWTLPPVSIEAHPSCALNNGSSSPGYLLFEFWRLDRQGEQPDSRPLQGVLLLLAKGTQPNVSIINNAFLLSPPRGSVAYSGTLQDSEADTYSRAYQRILVPRNAPTSRPGASAADTWFVTVANMQQPDPLFSYKVRVSCLAAAADAPCAAPTPSQPPCGGRGACIMPPGGFTRVCRCEEGWGDYDCQRPAPLLANGGTAGAVIQPDAWAFWQLRVPLPEGGAAALAALPRPPALLVELNHGGGGGGAPGTGLTGGGGGGDPVLVVTPKPASGQVPWFTDVYNSADLNSYFLLQNLHYRLLRDPQLFRASPFPLDNGTRRSADFYVAVYNNNQRFNSASRSPLSNPVANVTLRVRWLDLTLPAQNDTAAPRPPPLCPGDCYGRGTCYDPRDPANAGTLPPPQLPPLPPVSGSAARPSDFQCACRAGAAGTLCEGTADRLNLTRTSAYVGRDQLLPGQWKFVVVHLDNKTFDYRTQNINIRWYVADSSPANASGYINAFMTVNAAAFPRDSDFQASDPLRRGYQLYYSSLAQRANPPLPMMIRGSDLTPGASAIVVGVYNSEYHRQVPYTSSLQIDAVSAPPPPRPPRPPMPARAIPPQPPGFDWVWWTAPPPGGEEEQLGGGAARRPPPSRARRLPPGLQRHQGGAGVRSPPAGMRVTTAGGAGDARQAAGAPPPSRRRREMNE
ncbi:hypothetical protein HXX76_014987 [Chlamydomonas incerta]|uniref:EGF-like domain-containing protein n=1 Tax=Chlamydomonas incerta TaxID=51695 RepID=A0A835SFH4_CHLIN|nr:hypothetical protein HXX76_014987 [Chlamydomonas incerta]|eukprot:KAG2423827.1 hypothetical protein HXX76_014987 [Chlamydomonas incerta]